MSYSKRMGLWLAASLVSVFLLAAVWTSVSALTIGRRDTVKDWLTESHAYSMIVDAMLDGVKSSDTSKSSGTVPIDQPEIKAVAEQAFNPAFLKENTEKALDGTYNWLEGKTDKPDFKLDLTAAKQKLADGVGAYATKRLAGLPVCVVNPNPADFDAFSADCRPRGLDPAAIGAQVTSQLMNDKTFLGNTVITADSLNTIKNVPTDESDTAGEGDANTENTTASGQQVNFFEQGSVKRMPRYYQLGKIAPVIFGLLALICLAIIIFMSPTRGIGLTRAGFTLLWTGGILIVTTVFIGFAASRMQSSIVGNQMIFADKLVARLVGTVVGDINHVLRWFGISFAAFGVAGIIFGMVLRRGDGNRNEYGKKLAPKESPAATRERYKRELQNYIKTKQTPPAKKGRK